MTRRPFLVLAVLLAGLGGHAEAGARYTVECLRDPMTGKAAPAFYNHAWLVSDRRSRLVAFRYDHAFDGYDVGFCDYDVGAAPARPLPPQPGKSKP